MHRFHNLALAAAHGFIASFGFLLARWLTDAPYSAAFIRYDVSFCVVVFVVAYGLAGLRAAGDAARDFGRLGTGLLIGLHGLVWVPNHLVVDESPVLTVVGGMLFSVAVFAFLLNWWMGRRSGWTVEGFALASGTALAAGSALRGESSLHSLVLPVVLSLALIRGLPRGTPAFGRSLVAALLVQLATVVTCSTAVYPFSAQLVELPRPKPASVDASSGARSVLMIVIDTLRQDHLSMYGYGRETTPRLDRWAASGVVFEQATAASSWTLPSHASIFTGLYPRTHGAHGFRSGDSGINAHPLPEEVTTLAELASGEGIATAAIIANSGYLSARFGLDQGFDTYWAEAPKHPVRIPFVEQLAFLLDFEGYIQIHWPYYRDRYITDNAIRWLQAVEEGQFFLFLNYMDVHGPSWRPPNEAVPHTPGAEEFVDPRAPGGRSGFFFGTPPKDVRNYRVNHYDRELVHLDGELDRLFRFLEASGLAQSTVVIVTSDHGEYLGEHGMMGHSAHLHEEVVKVPLIIKGPGIAAGRSSRPTHSVDLFGAALDFLGVEIGRHPATYFSILSEEHPPVVSEWYASENTMLVDPRMQGRFDRDLRAIEAAGLKLFVASDGKETLHDLNAAGGETVDLAATRPDDVHSLRDALGAWLESNPAQTRSTAQPERTPADDEEIKERLRALGYID